MRSGSSARSITPSTPQVWDYFVQFSFEKIKQGYKHYSAMGVWQRLRWELSVGADGVSEFKINNNYVPYYARAFMKKYPQHDGFFRTREPHSGKTCRHWLTRAWTQ